MNQSAQIQGCSRCGGTMVRGALKGLCPRCLMELNLTTQTDIPWDDAGSDGTTVGRPPPAPAPSPEEIARLFPQFEILGCLGRGGMGAVYRARQPKLDRFVALKVLAPERKGDSQFAERFAREARALARLNHPDIVAVHDFGEAGGYPYLVMEYVDGLSLRQLLQRGKLAPKEALVIVPKICEALQFAHQQGIVHRDIKPENILVDKLGRVKIADFGIAKILAPGPQDLSLTGGNDVVGTPHYMAPEQVEHPTKVDHRADIFSLGVVFYEMLTGELPLGRFQPPSRKVQVDVRLDEVVLHALEKEPERRYQQASDVKSAVETIATSYCPAEATHGLPGTRRAATSRWWRWAAVLGVAVFIAVWLDQSAARRRAQPAVPPPPENIVFPADAGIVDVTQPPYNAKADAKTDATAAIQRALTDFRTKRAIIYLPNGTYLVSDTLRWGQGQDSGSLCKFTTLQGQNRDCTILRLRDGCPGFSDAKAPQAVVWTGPRGAERYRNSIRNLTVDTGTNNAGAIGVQFNANQGCLRDVVIRSGDGRGVTGLDMAFADDIGPLLVKNLAVRGFNVGIHTKEVLNSQTFEHITLEDQGQVGFLNEGQTVSIRDLTTRGRVPAFRNEGNVGLAVIVDAKLNGHEGSRAHAAILNRPGLLARNITVNGFGLAIAHSGMGTTNVAGPFVEEWASGRLPGCGPPWNLSVKETPEVPWDDLAQWANVVAFGASPDAGGDDSSAIQRAIDSGKSTVYLPRGDYTLRQPIQLRGAVRRLIGCEAFLHVEPASGGGPILVLADGKAPVVVVERLDMAFTELSSRQRFIDNRSKRTLVLRDSGGGDSEFSGAGEVFLENVDGRMTFHGQRVWARQFSQRTWEAAPSNQRDHLRNEGGRLWVLGEKPIGPGPVVTTTRGGRTELLGGLLYSSAAASEQPDPAFVVAEGALSVSINEVSHRDFMYPVLVRRVTKGVPTNLLMPDQARGGVNGSRIPLFTTE